MVIVKISPSFSWGFQTNPLKSLFHCVPKKRNGLFTTNSSNFGITLSNQSLAKVGNVSINQSVTLITVNPPSAELKVDNMLSLTCYRAEIVATGINNSLFIMQTHLWIQSFHF